MRARSLLFIVAAFSAAAVTSCGSDDGGEGVSDEEQTYADAWAATLADGDQDTEFADDEAACMGEADHGGAGRRAVRGSRGRGRRDQRGRRG